MSSWSEPLKLWISIISGLIILLIYSGSSCAQPADAQKAQEISTTSIEKLLNNLEDPQQLENLKQDLRTLLAVQKAANSGGAEGSEIEPSSGLVGQLLAIMSGQVQNVSQVFSEVGNNVLEVPALVRDLAIKAQNPEILRSWIEMFVKIALVLLAGFIAQWLISRLLSRARKSVQDHEAYSKGVRALLLIGSTLLVIIPVAAFAAAAYGLLPLMEPSRVTQLVALTLINAIVLVRVILILVQLILVPDAPGLRFLPLSDESVHYLYIWTRRVVVIGVYGYFILEAALLLGFPISLYTFLLKALGLVITAMAVVLILQNRKDVVKWLRGDELQTETDQDLESKDRFEMRKKMEKVRALRKRLAEFWHIAAIVLVVGMFGTWALEIEGGFQFLARAIVLTALIIVLVTFLIGLSMRGMNRLFKISEELKHRFPELELRANRYLPVLNNTVKAIIYVIAVFSILQAWGLGALSWLFSSQGQSIISSLVIMAFIIGAAFLIWEIVSAKIEMSLALEKRKEEEKRESTRKLTLLPLVRNVIMISIIIVTVMSVLAHLGINIAPLLAGAGVIGLAIGFGAQTLVKDVITGAFILIENSIAVGDWVEAGGHAGTVENLTVRTLTLRDLTGTVHVVPFGDVTSVLNYNRDYGYALVDAGVAYRENYGEVVQALQDVAAELQEDENWSQIIIGELEVFGLNNLGDSAVEVRVRLKTKPLRQFAVRRAFLERMKRIFDERGIEIPFPHRTVWFGTDKEGQAPAMRVVQESKKSLPDAQKSEIEVSKKPQPEPEINYYNESDASKDVVQDKEQSDQEKQEKLENDKS